MSSILNAGAFSRRRPRRTECYSRTAFGTVTAVAAVTAVTALAIVGNPGTLCTFVLLYCCISRRAACIVVLFFFLPLS